MLLVVNAKARCDGLVWYSESTKIAYGFFVCPLDNLQFTISERYVTPKSFLQFLNYLTLLLYYLIHYMLKI